jgi:phosphopantetheinyl transferase (holo-ACP synthase)
MNRGKREVWSCLEAVSTKDTARDTGAVLEAYFTGREIEKIKDGRVETICGNLAVKRAAKKVLFAGGFSGLSEKSIEIGRGKDGAPQVIFCRDDIAGEEIRVSISHTRDTAYGLAVYETWKDD